MAQTFLGRPRLPQFDPTSTPSAGNLAAWRTIVTNKTTGSYAAETLLEVFDKAVAEGDPLVADVLRKEILKIGRSHFELIAAKMKLDKMFAEDVIDKANEYLRTAIEKRTHDDGTPFPNYFNMRGGFFRYTKNRFIDAGRIEARLCDKCRRAEERRAKKRQVLAEQVRNAMNGRDVEEFAIFEDEPNKELILYIVYHASTWKEAADHVGLPSADAARKRFDRFIERLTGR